MVSGAGHDSSGDPPRGRIAIAGQPTSDYGALLDSLRGTSWPTRRTVRSGAPGTHRSRLQGIAPEFTEYRAYRQGDDPRRLAWKVLARTDRAYLHVSDDRATLATCIIVDASASMAFPGTGRAKWVCAREIAVGLAGIAHASGDPVGLTVQDGSHGVPVRTRRGLIGEMIRLLEAVSPSGSGSLAPAIRSARPGSRVVVVSDFLGDLDAMLAVVRRRVVEGVEVHAVHVVAREELDPPQRAFVAVDPEQPHVRHTLGGDNRAGYADAFARWRSRVAEDWRAGGAHYVEVVTDEAAAHAVRRIVAGQR